MSQKDNFDLLICRFIDAHVQLYDSINTVPICAKFGVKRDKASAAITAYRTHPEFHNYLRYNVTQRCHEKTFTFVPRFTDHSALQILTSIDNLLAVNKCDSYRQLVKNLYFRFIEAYVSIQGAIKTKVLQDVFSIERSHASRVIRDYKVAQPDNLVLNAKVHERGVGFSCSYLTEKPDVFFVNFMIAYGLESMPALNTFSA